MNGTTRDVATTPVGDSCWIPNVIVNDTSVQIDHVGCQPGALGSNASEVAPVAASHAGDTWIATIANMLSGCEIDNEISPASGNDGQLAEITGPLVSSDSVGMRGGRSNVVTVGSKVSTLRSSKPSNALTVTVSASPGSSRLGGTSVGVSVSSWKIVIASCALNTSTLVVSVSAGGFELVTVSLPTRFRAPPTVVSIVSGDWSSPT